MLGRLRKLTEIVGCTVEGIAIVRAIASEALAEPEDATTSEIAGGAAALGCEHWRALRSAGARSAPKRAVAMRTRIPFKSS